MLTKTQNRIVGYLRQFMAQHNYAPTIAEIAHGLGLKSRSAIHRALRTIASHGFINIIPGKRRNIELLEQRAGYLPLVGTIAAGEPIEAIENVEWVNLAGELFTGNRFLLRVKGESMIEENICDGDMVICQKVSLASNHEIVVALIDKQEATLKRIKHEGNNITLSPANSNFQPQTYSADRVEIQGIYIGLLRLR